LMLLLLFGVLSLPMSLPAKPSIQALGEQAIREAERVWLSAWTNCGGSHVARFDGEYCVDIACTGGRRRSPRYISQRRDVYFIVTETRRLSEADRLNGVSWFGEIRAKWTAEREYSFKSNRWSNWRTPAMNAVFVLERRNGRWNVRGASMGGYDAKVTKITCAEFNNPASNMVRSNNTPSESAASASPFRGNELDIAAAVRKLGANEWEVILPANLQQLDTEQLQNPIYVRAGQTVVVSASGRVNHRRPTGGASTVVGPDGWPSNPAFNRGLRSPLPPYAPFMSLAMRIGVGRLPVDDGGWVFVGSQKRVVAREDGYLHFTVNDMSDPTGETDWWNDNEGAVKIRVRVQ
jgi:hypothetical protein